MLRAYVRAKTTKWERYLPILDFPQHKSKHTLTRYSLFMLLDGSQPQAPINFNIYHDELRSAQRSKEYVGYVTHCTR